MNKELQLDSCDKPNVNILLVVAIFQALSGLLSVQSGWLLIWSGFSFFLVWLAYNKYGPKVFGKKPNGDRSWLSRIVLFPYLAANVAVWHYRHRVLSEEDKYNKIIDGVWLGRRPIDGELPPNITLVVDLTAELTATPQLRNLDYICLPTLDGCAYTDLTEFSNLVSFLKDWYGDIYIHCAAGHGRSAMLVAALLVARGNAANLEDAEELIRKKRPGIMIKSPQWLMLNRWIKIKDHINSSYFERTLPQESYAIELSNSILKFTEKLNLLFDKANRFRENNWLTITTIIWFIFLLAPDFLAMYFSGFTIVYVDPLQLLVIPVILLELYIYWASFSTSQMASFAVLAAVLVSLETHCSIEWVAFVAVLALIGFMLRVNVKSLD